MILLSEDGKTQIRGDAIVSAVVRSDLSPVPVTMEAEVRSSPEADKLLQQDKVIQLANGDLVRVVKSVRRSGRTLQGEREMATINVVAMLDACHSAAFVRQRAIIKENATLAAIYRACGGSLKSVESDFPAPRFYCPVGGTPTFHIARILQEEGGVVGWKAGKLRFFRLQDLLKQKAVMDLPTNAAEDVDAGFLERHEIPWFFSVDDAGKIVFGNRKKPRLAMFAPRQNEQKLINMTRCLVHRKVSRLNYSAHLHAGDLVNFAGGEPMVIMTAAHVFESGSDTGGASNTYTRLWLGTVED